MSEKRINKILFKLYSIMWDIAIPLLRLNPRLAEGFEHRTLKNPIPKADIWIQAASAGEAYLAELLLKELNPVFPIRIVVTSNTRQGIEILLRAVREIKPDNRSIEAYAAYFPFDKPEFMEKAVRQISPKVMVLLESEIWPGLLSALKKNNSKILIINGRMTSKSLKQYKIVSSSFWYSLRPDKVLAISKADAERFAALFGMKNAEIMPNMKFDRFIENGFYKDNPLEKIFPADKPFLVLGSIGEQEESDIEKILLDIYQKIPDIIIGLFPRHIHRIRNWKKRLNEMGIPFQLRSEITEKTGNSFAVILWDMFGELHSAYSLAKAAFVGGSLAPLGGQNFLEALSCGIVPVIGPHWETFEWVGKRIKEDGLIRVASNWKEVADILTEQMKHPKPRENVCEAAFRYIGNRKGGTNQACNLIREVHLEANLFEKT